MKQEIKEDRTGPGINIHPEIQIAADRETRHFFVCGKSGGGKTTIILPMIQQIVENKEKLLLYDYKGMTEKCPDQNPIILAPWDKRCWAWDISADIENSAHAKSFAARLIQSDSGNPMWSLGARGIFAAVVTDLINQKVDWTLRDVLDKISKDFDYLSSVLKKYSPELTKLLPGEDSRQTDSFLINISAYLSNIRELAEAWEGKPRISIKRWLLDQELEHEIGRRTLILQANEEYEELQKAYIQQIMEISGAIIGGPRMKESTTRRVWVVLDEIAQAGKIHNISKFLSIGRSKGVCVVLGIQTLALLEEAGYSPKTAEVWSSQCSTSFICETSGEGTKEFMAKEIGKEVVRKYMPSYAGGVEGQLAEQRQDSWQEKEEFIMLPSEVESDLGKVKDGIVGILKTGGDFVYKIKWPFCNLPVVREAVELADWTLRPMPPVLEGPEPEPEPQPQQQTKATGGQEQQAPNKQEEQQHDQQEAQEPEPEAQEQGKDSTSDYLINLATGMQLDQDQEEKENHIEKSIKEAGQEAAQELAEDSDNETVEAEAAAEGLEVVDNIKKGLEIGAAALNAATNADAKQQAASVTTFNFQTQTQPEDEDEQERED